MLKHLSFNRNKTTYLIQGQKVVLNFHFTKFLFILVYYNNGKYSDKRFDFNKFWNKISFMSPKEACVLLYYFQENKVYANNYGSFLSI